MEITVVGTGYVGLVAGVCFADVGHKVTCVDNNPEKINALKDGKIPIFEPGLEDILKSAKSRINFTLDIKAARYSRAVGCMAVGTPETSDGSADMRPTFSVLEEICQKSTTPKMIVLKSTVPVGTNKKAKEFIAQNSSIQHEIINNPEFLKEGAAIDDFLRPDRVVIGCSTEEAKTVMGKIYQPFVRNGHPIIFMSNTAAELTKYAANSFLSVKISFANELAALADAVGADINEVRSGFTSDNRINQAFFYPGSGYGGSCFPKDVQALIHTAKEHGCSMDIVNAADSVNDKQKTIVFDKLKKKFPDLKGKKFALWGLSFKPRTDDVREAPAGYVIEKLNAEGAEVVAYDPIATETAQSYFKGDFKIADSAIEACQDADALIVVTEWNEFRNPDYAAIKSALKEPLIFDGRNALSPNDVKKHGFEYYCVGRQSLFEGQA
ncbi:MAG: UDP-glucose/GDP-mannose dehydrogenase family protein [Bdellovibrionales bacterium]|nr:UDP-glucose/GDP-mannose dehydrogenase family protein [Bdellovibrionales bacterium]